MVDRIGLLTPKLAVGAAESDVSGQDVLADLRVGMNIALIQHFRASTPTEEGAALTDLLRRVGEHFSTLAAGRRPPSSQAALPALDSCLRRAVEGEGDVAARRAGIAALVGLRRNLFPEAPPFAHEALS